MTPLGSLTCRDGGCTRLVIAAYDNLFDGGKFGHLLKEKGIKIPGLSDDQPSGQLFGAR
jgi:hypothetical protein